VNPEELGQKLAPRFAAGILAVEPFEGLVGRVRFRSAIAPELFRFFRDDLGFAHLSMVGGIDWVDHREVVYSLWSDALKQYVLLSADMDGTDPHIETATAVWPSANWHEREAWELVGITFDHHPDLRHLLTPEGYEFHPLLRSFKLHEPEELEVKQRHV
jgi:NADH:ubiquinone oxidoreductase subunit C